jgi:hypothetical protein
MCDSDNIIKNDIDDTLEKRLEAIFKNINDWLKFAEQKNGALLVLNVGIVWGMTRIVSKAENIIDAIYIINVLGYIFIVLSTIICLFSFFPILTDQSFKISKFKNSKYKDYEYLRLISKKLGIKKKYTCFEKDYANQIINNSKIAAEKYKRFRSASILTVLGILFFSVSILTQLVIEKI